MGDLICVVLHISFLPFFESKRSKTLQNGQITSQISLECVFVYFRYKGLKTDEKRANYEELAETVPRLSENGRIGPWWNIFENKSIKVLHKSKNDKNGPLVEISRNYNFGPSSLEKWQK